MIVPHNLCMYRLVVQLAKFDAVQSQLEKHCHVTPYNGSMTSAW